LAGSCPQSGVLVIRHAAREQRVKEAAKEDQGQGDDGCAEQRKPQA
jgi:hypothetical protein